MGKPLITAKIDVTKINKAHLFQGKTAKYLDVAFFENEGESKFGDDGFIRQSVSKEARARGEKGEIIGNWRYLEQPQQSRPSQQPVRDLRREPKPLTHNPALDSALDEEENESIPF